VRKDHASQVPKNVHEEVKMRRGETLGERRLHGPSRSREVTLNEEKLSTNKKKNQHTSPRNSRR